MSTTRRKFFQLGAGGLATAAIAPTLWIPRRSLAATPASGMVKHLIVVHLDGGARSQCLFNADVAQQWNPTEISGVQAGAPGTQWGVGGVFSATAHAGGIDGETIPSVPQISDRICVLGTVDHTPGLDAADADHNTASLRMATGAPDGTRGLFTIVHRDHASYQDGNPDRNLPPVVVGGVARRFGGGSGDFGPYRPIVVDHWSEFIGAGDNGAELVARPWSRELGSTLDERFAATRSARHRALVAGLTDSKRQVADFSEIFTNPVLDVTGKPSEAKDGLTNAELLSALVEPGIPEDTAYHTALALRFLGFGAPAVAIGIDGWDFHSDELAMFPAKGRELGRTFAALAYLLERMPHPDGGTYWDHSLVVATSEFSRDNTELGGFNSGNGSDHVGSPACRYQALPFMGGVVGQGGKLFGATDFLTAERMPGEPVFSSASMLAMCLDVLGIDPAPHFPDAPLAEVF